MKERIAAALWNLHSREHVEKAAALLLDAFSVAGQQETIVAELEEIAKWQKPIAPMKLRDNSKPFTGPLNERQKEALRAFGTGSGDTFRYPYQVSPMQRASTCHALERRGLLEVHYACIGDWGSFRITAAGRAWLLANKK